MTLLLGGSLAAAFAAGMVAFFAPCCAGVMLPAYLAAIGGGRKLRVARLSALYVAGVTVVVLPITMGAASIASTITHWHAQLFTLGGLMMIGVAVALWRGSMMSLNVPQPRMTGSLWSVFGLGAFSGASTACCAPVLAGAIALSATSGTVTGGLLLGAAYVTGMMAPLIPIALVTGRYRGRIGDKPVTISFKNHHKRIGVMRLGGAVMFAGFGVLFIILALIGKSNTAPAYQRAMGDWVRGVSAHLDAVPNVITLPILVTVAGAFAWYVVRGRKRRHDAEQSEPSDTNTSLDPEGANQTTES